MIDQIETRLWTKRHRDGHSSIQFDDGRWVGGGEELIERGDAGPVGLVGRTGTRVTGGDRRLKRVGTRRHRERLGAGQGCQPAGDQQVIPDRTILVQQQDGLAARTETGARS